MARCTKRRVRNGKLVQILLTDTRPPLQQNWTALHMESAMFTEQCVTCTLQTNHRDLALEEIYNYVNNDLSIAAEDVVWMEAQNPCSAPIFQTSYNVLMNTSYKYKYKCSVFGFLLLTIQAKSSPVYRYTVNKYSRCHAQSWSQVQYLILQSITCSKYSYCLHFKSHPLYLYLYVFMAT